MQADVLVLHHDAAGFEIISDIEILGPILRRRLQALAQIGLIAVGGEGDAIHRTDVDAGVAFDAKLAGEYRLYIAIGAALGLLERQLEIIAKLNLSLDVA